MHNLVRMLIHVFSRLEFLWFVISSLATGVLYKVGVGFAGVLGDFRARGYAGRVFSNVQEVSRVVGGWG